MRSILLAGGLALLGTLLGRYPSAMAVAILAPWLNWIVTGYPKPPTAAVTMLQLLVFVGVLRAALRRFGPRWFLALPAYTAAMLAAIGAALVFPALIGGRAPFPWALATITLALPGVAILILLNWLAVRSYPGDGSGREAEQHDEVLDEHPRHHQQRGSHQPRTDRRQVENPVHVGRIQQFLARLQDLVDIPRHSAVSLLHQLAAAACLEPGCVAATAPVCIRAFWLSRRDLRRTIPSCPQGMHHPSWAGSS